jgi:tetratricopeptide (TPR) repeat protein
MSDAHTTSDTQLLTDLTLAVADGRAVVSVGAQSLFGWMRLERLELEVPAVGDTARTGDRPERFQRRRCRVLSASLSVDDAGLESLSWRLAATLSDAGFDEVRMRILDGAVALAGRVRVGARSADFTARLTLDAGPRTLRVVCGDVRVFGFVERPAPLVGHDLLAALARAGSNGLTEPATPQGLGALDCAPLETLLWRTLPPAGWRLPDASQADVVSARTDGGRFELAYGAPGRAAAPRAPHTTDAGDALLLGGDLDGASAAYRVELGRGGPDGPRAAERLLGVLAGRASTLREAEQAARETLARWPGLVAAHLALAAALEQRGRPAEAAEHLGRVADIGEESGDDEDAVRAAVGAARLLKPLDPAAAALSYARVLERRPAHAEAAEALVERFSVEERWTDLVRLAQRRIGATAEPVERAREHVRLGETYLGRIGDPGRARAELERAIALDDTDPRAHEALARALAAQGEPRAAADALDRQVALLAAKGDGLGEARTHARIGALMEEVGADDKAEERYRRALALAPGDDELLERLARVALRRGRLQEGVAALERLAAMALTDERRRRRAGREVARALLVAGELGRARAHLERAGGGEPEEELERLELIATLDEKEERPRDAAAVLAQAAGLDLPPARLAAVELRRGRLAEVAGDAGAADAARERAFALAPEAAGAEAARALALAARAHGDGASEARWLDVLLRLPGGPATGELAVRRAELALAKGQPSVCLGFLDLAGAAAHAPAARVLRARALAASGHPAAAARTYDELAADGGDVATALDLATAAAEAHLAASDPAGALAVTRNALAHADLADAPAERVQAARVLAGEAAWQLRAWDDVLLAYEPLAARSVETARRLGMALERKGREDEAAPVYRRAVTDPAARGEPLGIAWRRLAELEERHGNFAAASAALTAGASDARTGESPTARADEHHRAAEILRRRLGDNAGAVVELEAALRLFPEHMPSLDALESIADEAQDLERVATILGRKVAATAKQPDRQKAVLARLADLQHLLGRPDAALEAYRRALAIDPEMRPALAYLAAAAAAHGDRPGAEALYRRLVAGPAPSSEAELHERVGHYLALAELAEDDAGAEAVLEEAHVLAPERDDVLAAMQTLYRAAERWKEAADCAAARADLADEEAGREARELERVGYLRDGARDLAAAWAACRAALVRSPDSLALWRALLGCAQAEGDEREIADIEARVAELEAAPARPEALAARVAARARDLRARGVGLDDETAALLEELRVAARTEGDFAPLADALIKTAGVERDRGRAAGLFAEAASLRRGPLDDPEGAANALGQALALRPEDASLVSELTALLRSGRDLDRLADALVAHAGALSGASRAQILVTLGHLFGDELGDSRRAAAAFAQALDADPETAPLVHLPLAQAALGHGDRVTAERHFAAALAADVVPAVDRAHVMADVGQLAALRDAHAEAAARYREALDALGPNTRAGDAVRAGLVRSLEASLRASGDHEALAEELTRRARESPPSERLPLLREAAQLLDDRLGRPDQAAALWAEVYRLDPDDQVARQRRRPTDPLVVDPAAAVRAQLRDDEDWLSLVAALERDAAATSGEPRALLLGEAARVAAADLGRPEDAEAFYARALEAARTPSTRGHLLAERAELRARGADLAAARTDVEAALTLAPPSGPAHLALGRLHLAEQRVEAALPYLAAAAGADDLDPRLAAEANLLSGQAHEALGHVDAAMSCFEQASAALPFDPRPLDALTALGEARGDHDLIAELLGRRILLCTSNHERARLWVRRARLYRDVLGREPETYRCLKEAFANDPEWLESARELRRAAGARGEWALCAELLYREIDGSGDTAERARLHAELAAVYEERLHDADGAIRNWESARELDPHAPVPPAALAHLYARAGRTADAARAEEQAAAFEEAAHARADRLLRAGDLYERSHHLAEAVRVYQAASTVDEGGDAAAAGAAKAARLGERTDDPARLRAELLERARQSLEADERVVIARQLLQLALDQGDAPDIDTYSRELLARDPTDAVAYAARRTLLAERGEVSALAELARTRADHLGDPTERAALYHDVGRLTLSHLGDVARAAHALEQALALDPNHAATLDVLSDLAYRQHDWERASQLYARLPPEESVLGPDVVHYRRGELAEMLGRESDAEGAYHAAVAANPYHVSALEAIARLALYRGETTAAIAALRAVLDLMPLDDVERITSLRQQLGDLCARAGDDAAARAYYELVLVEDPGRVAVLAPLADLYIALELWPQATSALARLSCLVVSPEKRAEILFRLGELHRLQLGNEEHASDAFLKAIDLDPGHVPTMRRLIEYYWKEGDDAGLGEMAAELDARGALLAPDTTSETLAQVAVSRALGGEEERAAELAGALGDGAAGALAAVLANAAELRPDETVLLGHVARVLCRRPGPPLEAVTAVLAARAEKDAHAARLVGVLRS